jgi:hypothetical protein
LDYRTSEITKLYRNFTVCSVERNPEVFFGASAKKKVTVKNSEIFLKKYSKKSVFVEAGELKFCMNNALQVQT